VSVSFDAGGLHRGFEVRELLDTNDMAVVHVDDARPASEKVRAPTLQRTLVGRVDLDAREPNADDDAVGKTDRAVDDDVVRLGDPLGEHGEYVIAADEDSFLARGDPFDIGIEHLPHRDNIAGDERAVPAQKQIDTRVTHEAESMEPRGLEPLAFALPARRSPS
jgi:hypothetical protein